MLAAAEIEAFLEFYFRPARRRFLEISSPRERAGF
jgi:hypothetical protein